ncbi:MAG TPA: peptidoglycan DD-metalloendopeptidase family protein [Thermoanaerobacterales bacterium]|nr:peptidoglycan DD-metalloendopeptidase family protein [Thermoanaerobacterales bacterium]
MIQEENETSLVKFTKLVSKYKKNPYIIGIAVALVILISTISYYNFNTAFAVEVDGVEIGIVKNKTDFKTVINEITDELKAETGSDVQVMDKVEFKKMKGFGHNITPEHELKDCLGSMLKYNVKAAVIVVSGQKAACVRDKDAAENVIEKVKTSFARNDGKSKLEEAEIEEEIVVKEDFLAPEEILDEENAIANIIRGTDEIKVHKVKKGESLWTIARNNKMTVGDLKKANPQIKNELIRDGQELNLIVPKPYVNVITKEVVEYNESIPFTTKVERDSNLWSWETRVKKAGTRGVKEIKAMVICKNGVETEREILEEKITKEPSAQIVSRGTKSAPSRGTGRFLWPVSGKITSLFGKRGREYHTGVDIGAPTGTYVKASDSGTVTFAGTSGNYGRLVKIDHGNGYVTYYAHNSKLLVSRNEKVEKGQTIARVGSTGRSTGPHLHFEIRKNGSPINPMGFFR